MKVRRVVTGHDRDGKAVFASDEEVDPLTLALMPGAEFHRLWGADQAPDFPDGGSPTEQPTYFPPVGGYRFGLFTIPPATVSAPAEPVAVPEALFAGRVLGHSIERDVLADDDLSHLGSPLWLAFVTCH